MHRRHDGADYSINFVVETDSAKNTFVSHSSVGGIHAVGKANEAYMLEKLKEAGKVGFTSYGHLHGEDLSGYDYLHIKFNMGGNALYIKDTPENDEFFELLYSLDEYAVLDERLYAEIDYEAQTEGLDNAMEEFFRYDLDWITDAALDAACEAANIDRETLNREIWEKAIKRCPPAFSESSFDGSMDVINSARIFDAARDIIAETVDSNENPAFSEAFKKVEEDETTDSPSAS